MPSETSVVEKVASIIENEIEDNTQESVDEIEDVPMMSIFSGLLDT